MTDNGAKNHTETTGPVILLSLCNFCPVPSLTRPIVETCRLRKGAADMMLAAGTDLLLCTAQSKLTDAKADWARAELRRSARNILFVQANSLAMNGFEHGTAYTAGFPVYKILLIAVDILVALGLAWGVFNLVKKIKMTPEEFAARPRWSKSLFKIF